MHSFCALRRFAGPITLTTARQFTRKDSPPALFYVHSNHTPPASPETARTSATAACLFLAATPDLLALARGGADKAAAEAIAWTLGTALGLKYVAARA